jgi:hypothetical protein
MWGSAGQSEVMLHVRCHLLMSPENTTESSVWLMDNGDGTTVDAVLMQSNRGMMGAPEATLAAQRAGMQSGQPAGAHDTCRGYGLRSVTSLNEENRLDVTELTRILGF